MNKADHPLLDWAKARGMRQRDLAKTLQVSVPTLWTWTTGRRQPRIEHALRIQELTHGYIPVQSWAKQ